MWHLHAINTHSLFVQQKQQQKFFFLNFFFIYTLHHHTLWLRSPAFPSNRYLYEHWTLYVVFFSSSLFSFIIISFSSFFLEFTVQSNLLHFTLSSHQIMNRRAFVFNMVHKLWRWTRWMASQNDCKFSLVIFNLRISSMVVFVVDLSFLMHKTICNNHNNSSTLQTATTGAAEVELLRTPYFVGAFFSTS